MSEEREAKRDHPLTRISIMHCRPAPNQLGAQNKLRY
jgi:hypothetical protein